MPTNTVDEDDGDHGDREAARQARSRQLADERIEREGDHGGGEEEKEDVSERASEEEREEQQHRQRHELDPAWDPDRRLRPPSARS